VNYHVIVACHNRKELTVQAITRAQIAADVADVRISFTVFDDGSTDGTAEALSAMSESIRVLRGDGSAFWAQSMAIAEKDVLSRDESGDGGFLVWLNDDVALDENAFVRVKSVFAGVPEASIVVGAMRDPTTSQVTYSGMRRNGLHPLSYELVDPGHGTQLVDTFNGNFVVVPIAVAVLLKGIDGGFSHALADIDYGIRAARAGIPRVLAPGTFGTCERNQTPPRQSIRQDWRAFLNAKGGGNYLSLRRILRKRNRLTWRFVIALTYLLWWARRFVGTGRKVG
jgi:GT2 family glycosyltransferase